MSHKSMSETPDLTSENAESVYSGDDYENGALSYYEDIGGEVPSSLEGDAQRQDSYYSDGDPQEYADELNGATPGKSKLDEFLYLTESLGFQSDDDRVDTKHGYIPYESMKSIPENQRVKFREESVTAYTTSSLDEKITSASSSDKVSSKVNARFFAAAEKGDVTGIRNMLDSHPKLDPDKNRHYQDRTALHQAAGYGQLDVVSELLAVGADPDFLSVSGRNALHEACQGGHDEVLQKLLDFTRSVNVADKQGQSPAHVAAVHGEVKCLDVLVEKGADLELPDKEGRKPVHLAAKHNHRNVLEYLYGKGLDLRCADQMGKLPVHYAAQYGATDALQCLVERECDITLPDRPGNMPLHLSVMNNYLDCVRFLATQGSSLVATRPDGRQPVHLAALKGSTKVLHWLCEQPKVDVLAKDKIGNTALHLAAMNGHSQSFHCLLQHDAQLEIQNEKHEKPMDTAKKSGHKLSMEKALQSQNPCPICLHQHDVLVFNEATGPAPVARIATRSAKKAFTQPLPSTPSLTRNYYSKTMYKLPIENKKKTQNNMPKRSLAAKFYGGYLESDVKD